MFIQTLDKSYGGEYELERVATYFKCNVIWDNQAYGGTKVTSSDQTPRIQSLDFLSHMSICRNTCIAFCTI